MKTKQIERPGTPQDHLPGITDRLDALATLARSWREAVEAQVDGHPSLRKTKCGLGEKHPLNLDRSARASWQAGEVVLVYDACEACAGGSAQDRRDSRLARAGVPKILLGATLQNWRATNAAERDVLRQVRDWAEAPEGVLMLVGPPGVGKTHLACGVMAHRLKRGLHPGLLKRQGRLLLDLRATYRDAKAPDVLAECQAAALLVLDEMGVSAGGRDEFPAIWEVLSYRHGEDLPTILTTNLEAGEWDGAFGARLLDRIRCGRILTLSGPSKRGGQKTKK